jgi:hypothetical protein
MVSEVLLVKQERTDLFSFKAGRIRKMGKILEISVITSCVFFVALSKVGLFPAIPAFKLI